MRTKNPVGAPKQPCTICNLPTKARARYDKTFAEKGQNAAVKEAKSAGHAVTTHYSMRHRSECLGEAVAPSYQARLVPTRAAKTGRSTGDLNLTEARRQIEDLIRQRDLLLTLTVSLLDPRFHHVRAPQVEVVLRTGQFGPLLAARSKAHRHASAAQRWSNDYRRED